MNGLMLKLFVRLQDLKDREEGQDIAEYALVVALVAFGAIAGMRALATGVDTSFLTLSARLNANV